MDSIGRTAIFKDVLKKKPCKLYISSKWHLYLLIHNMRGYWTVPEHRASQDRSLEKDPVLKTPEHLPTISSHSGAHIPRTKLSELTNTNHTGLHT